VIESLPEGQPALEGKVGVFPPCRGIEVLKEEREKRKKGLSSPSSKATGGRKKKKEENRHEADQRDG